MPSDRRWLPPPPLRPDRPRRPTLPRTRHHRQSTPGHRAPLRVVPLRVVPLRVVPLRVVPLRVVPLRVVPLRVVPLRVVPLRVVPLRVVPLRVVPLRVCLFGLCLFGLCLFGLCLFGLCLFGLCLFGLCLFGLCLFGLCLFGGASRSAGRSNQNPPATAGLQRPVTREWKSLRGLRPALPERQARSAAPKWTEEVTNPDLAPVRLWSLRPLAALPQTRFLEGGRSVGPWQPLCRSKLCRVRGPRRAPQ